MTRIKSLKGRSFLTLKDFEKSDICQLLEAAKLLKAKRKHWKKLEDGLLLGKHLVMLFEKTSTRTRCSFEVAMKDEGGCVTFLDKDSSQFGRKESVEDTAKVLGRYYDAIEYRGFDQDVLEELAKHSGVPVYNGLTDVDHPTQILGDMMTIEEHLEKPLHEVKIAFVGDVRNNVARAWMFGAAKMGMTFVGCGPRELFPEPKVVTAAREICRESGGYVVFTEDVRDLGGVDVIYTDVWVSMGEEEETKKRVVLLTKYRVTMDVLRASRNPEVKFMHCLPAYHDFKTEFARTAKEVHGLDVREVTDEVFRSSHSIVFDQAENRMHAIKAILCNAAVGMKSLFDMIHEGPHKLMLFGAACTQVTDPIAKASKHWRLTQLSYADTHPMFTNDNFPNFFRIVPSENAFNPPRLKLLQEFNWTRVGTIYQNEPRFSLAHNRLVADLDILGFHVVETQSFANEVSSALSKLKEKDVRIILGNFNESWAREIFCEAYKFGMYGRKYQWLIMGTYSTDWWLVSSELRNCSLEELSQALEGCILTDLLPLSTNGEITISGSTAEEYRLEYDNLRGSDYSRFHGYTYDGIWTMALAIQHVALRIRHYRKNDTMKDFKYHDELWEQLFLQALKNTSFEGVTGPVRFYDNERKASIMLKQFQGGQEVKIGEFNGVTESLDLSRGHVIRWLGKHPPKDRTLQIFEHNQVNLTVYILLAATASLGIVMTIVFLTINIMYRNQRYIKMSSPYLNNLIIIGCMLTYSSVIFLGLDSQLTSVEAFPYVCTARAWLLMSGFSLAFGSMFSKTWRVHSIFTDVKLNKKVIKDYQLFIVVGVLVGIDLAIMTTWQVADPFYRETKQLDPYPDPTNDDILIIPENEYCQSEKMTIFIGSIYAYKGLLMIFGAFLAWETRHVSIPALNDSKYVGMSVYNVVIMCVMGAAISFVLSDKQDASFVIISVFIIFCTTATLCLVFVPKLVELKRNPQGVIDKKTRATLRPITKSRRDSVASELEDKIKDAKLQHSKYRKQLLDTESELQVLVRRLGSEAAGILESDSGTLDRLSVPLLRKEAPSGTETTEISSLCSLNSSQDEDYFGDPAKAGQQTPGLRKKSSFAKKTTFEGDNKQDSILRKEQRTRFADEEDKTKAQPPAGKNVSFGPPEHKQQSKPPQPQQQQQQQLPPPPPQQQPQPPPPPVQEPKPKPKPEVKTKSEQNLEKLGITQIHPKPRPELEYRPPEPEYQPQQYVKECELHQQTYEDIQERKIQEVTSHLTTQLLKKHDQQYTQMNTRRRSSVKSVNMNEDVTCQLEQRRTSVPNWSSNRINLTERKNNTKNAERKKIFIEEKKQWHDDRRPGHKKHGGYIEFAGSDPDANWSDYEGFGSEKDVYSNSSYQNYGYQECQEGLGGPGVVKYIEKDEYWVTQPDILSKRGSISQKGRISPYLLKDNVNNLSSPNVPTSVVDSPQAQDASCMQRSGSERGHRLPCYGSKDGGIHALPPPRVRPQISPSSSGKISAKHCAEHSAKPAKTNFNTNLTHVLSTPDVAAIRPYYDSKTFDIYATEKRNKSHKMKGEMGGSGHLCAAVSEGELLDLAILPIFQKLLTERHKSRTGYGASIASCPNISIKCDIVEYL